MLFFQFNCFYKRSDFTIKNLNVLILLKIIYYIGGGGGGTAPNKLESS